MLDYHLSNTSTKPAKQNYTLFVVLIIQFIFQLVIYKSGFPGASGDDFFRALLAYEWKESPFLISNSFGLTTSIWFPTHFWVGGAMYMLTNNLILSLTSISIIFSILELILLYQIANIIFNRNNGLLSVILVGFLPWQIWLGISMTEMTFYYTTILSAFLFFVKWQRENKQKFLLSSALFFLLATMLRPEGWIFAGMFSGYLILILVRRKIRRENYSVTIFAIVIPSVFTLFWFIYNFNEFGNPFYFLQANKENVTFYLDLTSIRVYVKSIQYLFLIFIISPVIFILAVVGFTGLAFSFVKCNSLQKGYLIIILIQLALITIVNLSGPGTLAAPQRYAFINVILLAPFAAFLLNGIWEKKYGRHIAVLILIIHLGGGITKSFYYTIIYKDTAHVGNYLRDAFAKGLILSSENICSELAFRMISGLPLYDKKEFLTLTSAHAALEAYSGKPRNFLFNILNISEKDILMFPESINKFQPASSEKIKIELAQKNVKKIILQDRTLIDKVPPSFQFEKMIGTYVIFSHNAIQKIQNVNESNESYETINKKFTDRVILIGYKYEGTVMEHAISTFWKINKPHSSEQAFIIKMQFASLRNPEIQFERNFTPIFYWNKVKNNGKTLSVKDTIPLFLPSGMPAGKYSIKMMLMQKNKNITEGLHEERAVTLPPVTLYSTKREILISFLKNPKGNWILLAKTLLLL